ncbi:MAG TPA: sigma-70 family RNA polymerase sigma factor [Armatimonadota bacterium]|nr:sigma-70 family RNA polymerase sigma factor [Armatimonadota bacterium]
MGRAQVAMVQTPQSLVSRFAEGDTAAFDEVVRLYGRDVYRVARRMTDCADDADDVVQETFIRAFQRLGEVDGDASVKRWLLTITINLCIDRHRRRRLPVSELSFDPPAERSAADHELLNRELGQHLHAALSKLSGQQRACFVLHEIEGLKVAEIAQIVGCSDGAVKCYLHRARDRLQKQLAPYLLAP